MQKSDKINRIENPSRFHKSLMIENVPSFDCYGLPMSYFVLFIELGGYGINILESVWKTFIFLFLSVTMFLKPSNFFVAEEK